MQALANDQIQRPGKGVSIRKDRKATIQLLDLTWLSCICQQCHPKLCTVHNLEECSQSVSDTGCKHGIMDTQQGLVVQPNNQKHLAFSMGYAGLQISISSGCHNADEYWVFDFTKPSPKQWRCPLDYQIGRYDEHRPGMYNTELFSDGRDLHVGLDIGARLEPKFLPLLMEWCIVSG